VAGLRARPHTRAIALAVDLPLLRRATLEFLLERLGNRAAVVPAPGGIPQPLSAVYSDTATAGLERALVQGERSVTAAAMALDPVLVGDAELEGVPGGAADFLNVNTPADLHAAERVLAARRTQP
jgi:molybdopterin-guanine dinucleotide biosynthesis protein A